MLSSCESGEFSGERQSGEWVSGERPPGELSDECSSWFGCVVVSSGCNSLSIEKERCGLPCIGVMVISFVSFVRSLEELSGCSPSDYICVGLIV